VWYWNDNEDVQYVAVGRTFDWDKDPSTSSRLNSTISLVSSLLRPGRGKGVL